MFSKVSIYALVILFLVDLLNLSEKLSNAELKLRQFFLLSDTSIVHGLLTHMNIQMNPLHTRIIIFLIAEY